MQPTASHPPTAPDPVLGLLTDLCALDSTSGREAELLPVLLPALRSRGARVDVRQLDSGRCNVLATWGEPRILFSTHLDTVPPFLPPRREGDLLFGRGACDAKGQMVAQWLALDRLLAEGRSDFAWLGVAGEETDSLGAQEVCHWADRFTGCRALINGEPTELKLAAGQRGVENLLLTCRGRAAHGGTPELGHSALLDLLDWLEAMRRLPLGRDPDLGPEVWNLGTLQGGTAVNIVPDQAQAMVNLRTVPGSGFRRALEAMHPAQGELKVLLADPPCRYPEIPGFDRAPMPFGSDLPMLGGLVPSAALVLAGPGSIRVAHTDRERIALADLLAGAELNHRLALHFLEQ
ncbi:MAG: M20/M25/M40 family metallo-hydrolase [Holophaga sp.]|nr:M20/M25/M40 family metallo-hydrolase [Holophaga sp.]